LKAKARTRNAARAPGEVAIQKSALPESRGEGREKKL